MALKVGKVLPTIEDVDPFDKSAVSLSPGDRAASVAVKELVEVPVRRPSQEAFFRVHADDNYTTDIAILENHLRPLLRKEIKPFQLYTCITRTGGVFLWPVRLPGEDGKDNKWWSSAHSIARDARTEWVRCTSSKDMGFYEKTKTLVALPDPEWPNYSFRDLMELAFGNQRIADMDHTVVKQRQGRI